MGNTIKFLRIAISAFMLIICTHPAFSLSVQLTCSTITEESTCTNTALCKWDNGECVNNLIGSKCGYDNEAACNSDNLCEWKNGECIQRTATSIEYITFNANGGSGTMPKKSFAPGIPVTLPKNNFSRTGYTFKHWTTTEEDDTDIAYGDEASVSLVSSITLYAQWTADTYTVTWDFDGGKPDNWANCQKHLLSNPGFEITETVTQGGTLLKPTYTYTYSGEITATYDNYLPDSISPNCKLYKEGYTFNGIVIPAETWGQSPDYYYDKDYNSEIWDRTEATTLKVFWKPNVIPVTLNPGNYTSFVQEASSDKIELKYGTGWYSEGASSESYSPLLTRIKKIPIVAEKVFNGFYYNDTKMIDNTGEFIKAAMTNTLFTSGSYTFNAQYTDCECSASTGVSSVEVTDTTIGNQCKCGVNCQEGYSRDGGDNATTDFEYTGTAGNAEVEVTCLPREYTITYDVTGEDNGPDTKTVKFGETLLKIASPTRPGYTFAGFYDSDGKKYYDSQGNPEIEVWDKAGDTTLYAKWNANMYKVALNNQSATSSGTTEFFYKYDTADGKCMFYLDDQLTQCVTANSTLISKPTKTGYTFQGYYTGENGSSTQYINSDGVINDDLLMVIPDTSTGGQSTLYAKWEPIQIVITLNPTSFGNTRYVYAQDPEPVKIRVTYGTDGFQKQDTEDAAWTTMAKQKGKYQLTKVPIVSKQIFGGYRNNKSRPPKLLIDERGVFQEDNFTSTTFESNTDAAQNFVPVFTPCECSASTGVSSVEVTDTTIGNQCKCGVNCQEGYSEDGGDNATTDFEYTGTAGVAKVEVTCNPRNYKVTYSCGDGATGTPPSQSYATYNSNFTPASTTTCTKTGYVFAGWTTTDNAENSVDRPAGTEFQWQYTGNKTFTAKWMQCSEGCYCNRQITEDDIKENNIICPNKCPDNFTSDAGASAITDCYLIPGTTFTDKYDTTFQVPDNAKYYWHNGNDTSE